MKFTVILVILVTLLAVVPAFADIQYTVTGIVGFGGYTVATAINNKGQVVGSSYTTGGYSQHAFIYSDGAMQDLGTFGGYLCEATDINDLGEVIGDAQIQGLGQHSFLYSSGSIIDISSHGNNVCANGINNRGQIVGQIVINSTGAVHSFLYENSSIGDIGTLGGNMSWANGINDEGQIVGQSNTPGINTRWHAYIYSSGAMQDLGNLGGDAGCNAINNKGQAVGGIYDIGGDGINRAFICSDGLMQIIGIDSEAKGINDNSQVVGWTRSTDGKSYASLYFEGSTKNLNDLIDPNMNIMLMSAIDINNSGQIICNGRNASGQSQIFLLAPVPEPSSLLVLTGCFLTLGLKRRKIG